MRRVRAWAARLAASVRRARADRDLADELESHLHLLEDEFRRRGLRPHEAHRRARIQLGGVDATTERCWDAGRLRILDHLLRDLTFGVRLARKQPGFTLVATASLAIGIGLTSVVLTVVDAAFFRPLPVAHPDQLVDIYTNDPTDDDPYATSSYPDYRDLRASNSAFTDILAYTPAFATLAVGTQSRLALAEAVSGNYFQVLGLRATQGRLLRPEDDRPGALRTVVISAALRRAAFGEDAAVVGQTLHIRGHPYTVVGVAPRAFTGLTPVLQPELWVPLAWIDEVEQVGMQHVVPSPGETRLERRGQRWLFLKGRLADGETVTRAAANLDGIMSALAEAYPVSNAGHHLTLIRTSKVLVLPQMTGPLRVATLGLILVAGLVLVVTCTNIAGMLLSRGAARRQELGLRLAIGAGRGRIIQQLLVESLVLATCGGVVGIAVTWALSRAIATIRPPLPLPVTLDVALDARAVLITVGVSTVAGILAGVMPAIAGSRRDLTVALRDPEAPSRQRGWNIRDGLVTAQVAITLLLLVAGGLMTRSAVSTARADVGFDPTGLATVSTSLELLGYDDTRATRFMQGALERVRAMPAVQSAALTQRLPLSITYSRDSLLVPGRHVTERDAVPTETTVVSAGYFETLGIPLLRGRDFSTTDTPSSPRVAIVNDVLARRYWPDGDAVGQRFRVRTWDGPEYQIVGVSANYAVRYSMERPTPYIHYAASQRGLTAGVIVARTSGDVADLAATIRRELTMREPYLVFVAGYSMNDTIGATLLPVRLAAASVGATAVVAMVLAAIGLYGLIAFAVVCRTRELGIRRALGAPHGAILWLVMRHGLGALGVGAVIGGAAAYAAATALSGVLLGVKAADPWAWVAAIALLTATGVTASSVPVRQAMRLSPFTALRVE